MQIGSLKWLKITNFAFWRDQKIFKNVLFFQSMSNQGTISLLELNGVRNRTRILKLIKKTNTFFSMPGSYQTGKFQSFHFSNNDKNDLQSHEMNHDNRFIEVCQNCESFAIVLWRENIKHFQRKVVLFPRKLNYLFWHEQGQLYSVKVNLSIQHAM